ncbi:hypothetical protein ACFU6I_17050 [Streptomyces sp. NPDC057486]|uniref:hypothetical protein n=1 Tax=Streptomyces sp. NPDC057486 TaxID=3346145 RepID=UPI0036915E31
MRDESPKATDAPVSPEVAALLAAVQRSGEAGPVAEQRALDAFRAARDEGAIAPVSLLRRRRRDDWRPVEWLSFVRSARAMIVGFAAAATLGGVAAAAGSGAMPTPFDDDGRDRTRPAHPARSASTASDAPGSPRSGAPDPAAGRTQPGPTELPGVGRSAGHPDQAQDDEAHCRAYRPDQGKGKAADATAFDRLEAAAGGASAVPGYCDGLLGPQTSKEKDRTGKGKSEVQDPGQTSESVKGNRNGAQSDSTAR